MQEKISMDAAHDLRQKCLCRARFRWDCSTFCDVCRQPDAAAHHHGCVRHCRRRVRGPAGKRSAERDVRGRRGNAGAAVFHRPDRRQGADHHGYKLGLYRRVQQRCGYHGRRCDCVWRDYGRVHSRRLFETVLGFFLKPLRKFFPAVVTGTVVLSIGLFADLGRHQFLRRRQLGAGLWFHGKYAACYFCPDCDSGSEARNEGIFKFFLDSGRNYCGYAVAFIMGLVLPHTGIAADGTEYTKAWVLNWDKVAQASWISIPPIVPG